MSNQVQAQTAPIEAQSGANSQNSYNYAQQSLGAAGNTVQQQAQPTLQAAGAADQNMVNTGGYTPGQESNYINRATSAATAAGNVAEGQSQLAAAKTGQGNPQAAISRIARQMGQNASSGAVNAEAGLNEQENANKLSGANQLAGVGSAQNATAQTQNSIGSTEANTSNQSAMQQMAAMGLQYNTEDEALQALTQMSNNAGPYNNILAGIGLAEGKPSSGATGG
jgi:hypothetical protein